MYMHIFFSGHYHPVRTIVPDQFSYLPSTYTAQTNLTAADQCDPCPEGHYCSFGTSML